MRMLSLKGALLHASLLALLATEVVAKSTFMDQAISSGQLKVPKKPPGKGKYALTANDSPDYHCRKDKPCALGCCGPL